MMIKTRLLAATALLAFAAQAQAAVTLARYTNFYRGDDDAVGQCFILDNSTRLMILDGIVPLEIHSSKIAKADLQKLKDAAAREVSAQSPEHTGSLVTSGTSEYNTMMVLKSLNPALADDPNYVNPKADGEVAKVIKEICNMESRD